VAFVCGCGKVARIHRPRAISRRQSCASRRRKRSSPRSPIQSVGGRRSVGAGGRSRTSTLGRCFVRRDPRDELERAPAPRQFGGGAGAFVPPMRGGDPLWARLADLQRGR
jgi:hypothetical protein